MGALISGATIVNEGRSFKGSVAIENGLISGITEGSGASRAGHGEAIDATGCFLLPGIIDSHVHFREPGLTHKADIGSESRAAAYGGVTTYFDMPNTIPQTTTLEALEEKFLLARERSHVNYSFFFGATNGNAGELARLDERRIPGIKVFMGSSTGGMLVDGQEALEAIFSTAAMPVMVHAEDTGTINREMERAVAMYGEDPDVTHHAEIRSREACLKSTRMAIALARRHGTRLHVAHVSTAEELSLFGPCGVAMPRITAEAAIAHLWFTDSDYGRLGTRIKCNPAVKGEADRRELRRALADGRVTTVATDHAPHALSEKAGGCRRAASGMPMVQFSLVAMLELVDEGVISIERLVELMCHNPARLFGVSRRGYIREGYKADLVVVGPCEPWTLTGDLIQSKCGWSPLEGHAFRWRVRHTFCNGNHIYDNGKFDDSSRGEEARFRETT